MGRWIAIGTVDGWGDFDAFQSALKATSAWRIDKKSSLSSVYALGDGRFVIECHAPDIAIFQKWMQEKSVAVESISEIKFVAKTGEVWKV